MPDFSIGLAIRAILGGISFALALTERTPDELALEDVAPRPFTPRPPRRLERPEIVRRAPRRRAGDRRRRERAPPPSRSPSRP